MRNKLTNLSRRYQEALRDHLHQGAGARSPAARGLGRQAVNMGLRTLDLVRIHERTLIKLILPSDPPATREITVRRAGSFFAEAIVPIEALHRSAIANAVQLNQVNQALGERSAELTASNQRLRQEIAQRKRAEESLRKSKQHYNQLLQQSQQMQEQLRLLSRQLLLAQEEERKKISRELHDVIGQTLTSINVRLASLKKATTTNTKTLERNIARTQELVEHSVKIVHRFARELRPTALDDLGLIPALHTFMKTFRQETGIQVSLSAFAAVEQVDGDKRTVLYRVAQEALTNVGRHAQASRAEVQIQKLDGAICMTIKDDGKGFWQEKVLRATKGERLGLLGMRERLEMVGGKFSVASAPGKGTVVLAQVPLMDGRRSGARRKSASSSVKKQNSRLT